MPVRIPLRIPKYDFVYPVRTPKEFFVYSFGIPRTVLPATVHKAPKFGDAEIFPTQKSRPPPPLYGQWV